MTYDCPLCHARSATQKERLIHAWVVHRRILPPTVEDTLCTCPWCFERFNTVVTNLRHTKHCTAFAACSMSGVDVVPEKRQKTGKSKVSKKDRDTISMLGIQWLVEHMQKKCYKW